MMTATVLSILLAVPLAAQVTSKSKPTTGVEPDPVYTTSSRPRALALIGDIYHGPVMMRDGLITALVRENIPVTFIEDPAALNAKALADCSLLIIARNGRYWPEGFGKPQTAWMSDAQQKAVWDFVNNGGGFLAVHNAHTMYPKGGLYYKLFGGDFGGHPSPYRFTIRIENKSHPITAGVEDYEIFDEQHMSKYDLDQDHLLLRSVAPDNKQAAAGWWNEFGKGRMCYLSPGHTPEALNHPMTQRLLRNAMRWVLHEDGKGTVTISKVQ
jgi:type 1 glutamine amidotransferase